MKYLLLCLWPDNILIPASCLRDWLRATPFTIVNTSGNAHISFDSSSHFKMHACMHVYMCMHVCVRVHASVYVCLW